MCYKDKLYLKLNRSNDTPEVCFMIYIFCNVVVFRTCILGSGSPSSFWKTHTCCRRLHEKRSFKTPRNWWNDYKSLVFQWNIFQIILMPFGSGTEFTIFNTRLHLLIGNYFWFSSSDYLSYHSQVIKISNSNFYKVSVGVNNFLSTHVFATAAVIPAPSQVNSMGERPTCSSMLVDLHILITCPPNCKDQM